MEGFEHEVFEFEGDLYNVVLCSEGTRFSTLRCNHKQIACLDGAIAERVDEVFGVGVTSQHVLSAPNKSNLYYCSIANMIYKEKETFVREVLQ